jgi:hypothetical protein
VRPVDQQRLVDAAGPQHAADRGDDVVLADQVLEALRAVFGCE